MDLQLTNKKALVTGSTAGIGFAIASLLAREGAAVVVNGRTAQRVAGAVQRIQSQRNGAQVTGVAADLGTPEGVEQMIRAVPQVDILVNNLSIFQAKPFAQISDEDWLHVFQVNILSGVRLSRAYLPQMIQQNWGRIVFIASESALNIPAEMIHYGVTKTAQLALARGLAETTVGTNVTVNSVLPGPTRSEGVEQYVQDMAKAKHLNEDSVEAEFFRVVRPSSLLKRFEAPEEVAALAVFVCSPPASAINGAALRVDGGVVRSVV